MEENTVYTGKSVISSRSSGIAYGSAFRCAVAVECGGFDMGGEWSIQFRQYEGVKCFALVSGQCWLSVEGVPDAVRLQAGDCFLLPRGRPFSLASDLSLRPVDVHAIFPMPLNGHIASLNGGGDCFGVGGYFALTGKHADILLGVLPPIVHREGIGQGGHALVSGADESRAARAAAGRHSGRTTTRLHVAGASPAATSGGRVERWRWVAICARGWEAAHPNWLEPVAS